MEITVINGSPKTKPSVTIQYVKYLEQNYPEIEFNIADVGKDIKRLENDESRFQEITEKVTESDGVLWAFPVYTCLVPYQLKRYMELIRERGADERFRGKYATSISTSTHFYDHTAHNFVHAVCEDMGMHYQEGFSAAVYDLLEEEKRRNLHLFFRRFLHHAEEREDIPRRFPTPEMVNAVYDIKEPISPSPVSKEGNILLLTDASDEDRSLKNMIDTFLKKVPASVEVQNLNDLEVDGGCLGCLEGVNDGGCVYDDGLESFIRNKFLNADAVIFAGTIEGRYLSAEWKLFFDRLFCKGRREMNKGKQIGYLISGSLSQNKNLEFILRVVADFGNMNLVGIVSDGCEDQERISSDIEHLGREIAWSMEKDFSRPQTSLSLCDSNVSRDLIYNMDFPFSGD